MTTADHVLSCATYGAVAEQWALHADRSRGFDAHRRMQALTASQLDGRLRLHDPTCERSSVPLSALSVPGVGARLGQVQTDPSTVGWCPRCIGLDTDLAPAANAAALLVVAAWIHRLARGIRDDHAVPATALSGVHVDNLQRFTRTAADHVIHAYATPRAVPTVIPAAAARDTTAHLREAVTSLTPGGWVHTLAARHAVWFLSAVGPLSDEPPLVRDVVRAVRRRLPSRRLKRASDPLRDAGEHLDAAAGDHPDWAVIYLPAVRRDREGRFDLTTGPIPMTVRPGRPMARVAAAPITVAAALDLAQPHRNNDGDVLLSAPLPRDVAVKAAETVAATPGLSWTVDDVSAALATL